jgi:transcriptional regulator with XRE-family HTH domain
LRLAAIAAIKAIREERGLSQRELARRLGRPVSFINKFEQLERRLDIEEFIAIAHAMEVAPSELLAAVTTSLPASFRL